MTREDMATISNRQDLANRIEALVNKQAGGLNTPSPQTIDDSIDTGLRFLSSLSPRVVTDTTFDGDGSTFQFALSALTVAWVNGFSVIRQIEHPTGEQDPKIVDPNDYILYPDLAAPTHLQFSGTTPESGTNNIGVTYTVPHTVDDTTSTLNAGPETAAAEYFCACEVCYVYATLYGQTTDPAIAADATDYKGKSGEWMELGDKLCAKGYRALGLTPPGEGGGGQAAASSHASGWVDHDPKTIYGANLVWRSRSRR